MFNNGKRKKFHRINNKFIDLSQFTENKSRMESQSSNQAT